MPFRPPASPQTGERGGLTWSERVPQFVGLFVISVSVVLAMQRHEFTSPNLGLLVIAGITLPWVLDMIGWPRSVLREGRFETSAMVVWSVVVLAGTYWLSISFRETYDFAPFIVTILIGQMAGTGGPKFGAAVLLVSITGLFVLTDVNHFGGMAIWGFAFTIGWMAGTGYRTQVEVNVKLSEAQSQLSRKAAEEERHRLARDVHDLIAHSLAVTMLQMTGARLALKADDKDEALAALEEAEATGRSALAEIHRTVSLLDTTNAGGGQYATPSAAEVPRLVDDFRRAGLAIDFSLDGDLAVVPMATGLASYRLVQESLSNAVKHAPGAPVRLRVTVAPAEIRINVVNPVVGTGSTGGSAGSDGSGQGVRGMAERAEFLGGRATAGNGDGTWKVDACIPWESESA